MTNAERVNKFNLAVGKWLQSARLGLEMSIEDAADEIQSSPEELIHIENGQTSVTGADFYALITLYEISSELVDGFLEAYGLKASDSTV